MNAVDQYDEATTYFEQGIAHLKQAAVECDTCHRVAWAIVARDMQTQLDRLYASGPSSQTPDQLDEADARRCRDCLGDCEVEGQVCGSCGGLGTVPL